VERRVVGSRLGRLGRAADSRLGLVVGSRLGRLGRAVGNRLERAVGSRVGLVVGSRARLPERVVQVVAVAELKPVHLLGRHNRGKKRHLGLLLCRRLDTDSWWNLPVVHAYEPGGAATRHLQEYWQPPHAITGYGDVRHRARR